jgi:hypothetical protein
MNIFFLDNDPVNAAQYSVDSHCVKMILETAQLLSTAHHILDGEHAPSGIYKSTHRNHPSAVWARQSKANYEWLYLHYLALLDEYTFRYGKNHKSGELQDILANFPKNIPDAPFVQPPPAMDVSYIVSDSSVVNYRNYYKYGKSHLHKYTRRELPFFLKDDT